jgi:hypothetical protein
MNYYKLMLNKPLNKKWMSFASNDKACPTLVRDLLQGEEIVVCTDNEIDYVIEWNRTRNHPSVAESTFDFWPITTPSKQ